MKINLDVVNKVSNIAKIELTELEKQKYLSEFKDIIDAFSILDEIKLEGVSPSFRPIEEKSVLREDEPKKSISQKEALQFTDEEFKEKGFFKGPKTVR